MKSNASVSIDTEVLFRVREKLGSGKLSELINNFLIEYVNDSCIKPKKSAAELKKEELKLISKLEKTKKAIQRVEKVNKKKEETEKKTLRWRRA